MNSVRASIPIDMRIAHPRMAGGPEQFTIMHRPVPQPAVGEVLIRIAAAGVNRADCSQREGKYPVRAGATDIIGLECSGVVVALGADVSTWNIGDRVCALLIGGGYAEYVNVPAAQCLPVPARLGLTAAASLMETICTVWSNVSLRAGIRPGETLLVHGGSSGIGVSAIQIYSALGHRVFTTAGNDEKCAACTELGSARAINYRTEDFVEVIRQETGGRGVDVVLDMVGGDYVARSLSILADDGRFVGIASTGGRVAPVDLLDLYRRRLTLSGSALRRQPLAVKAEIVASVHKNVWPLIESGRFEPVVYRTFELADAAGGHALMESSTHIGKIVLTVDHSRAA